MQQQWLDRYESTWAARRSSDGTKREIISTSHKCLLNSHSCFSSTMKGKKTDASANKRSGRDDDNLRVCVYSDRAQGRCYVTAGRLKGRQEEGFCFFFSSSPLFKPEVHRRVSCLNATFKLSPEKSTKPVWFVCERLNTGQPDQKPDEKNQVHPFMWKWVSSSETQRTIQGLVLLLLLLFFYKFNGSEPPTGGVRGGQ